MNIAYPFHFDHRGRTATVGEDGHIRQMIEELLFTNPGERVNRPDFGTGIRQFVFAPNSPDLSGMLQGTLWSALQLWLGDVIQLQAVEVNSVDSTLSITIQYLRIPTNQSVVLQITRAV